MRSREEVAQLMGAKDREVDDVQETDDGTVVTIHGFRTLIHEDGSMVHGVDEPEVEIVDEVSDEDAERIAAHVNGETPDDVVPEGSVAAILEWVGDDVDKAAQALGVELARDAPRSTLVAALEKFAA